VIPLVRSARQQVVALIRNTGLSSRRPASSASRGTAGLREGHDRLDVRHLDFSEMEEYLAGLVLALQDDGLPQGL
jgi:hypothetical protein